MIYAIRLQGFKIQRKGRNMDEDKGIVTGIVMVFVYPITALITVLLLVLMYPLAILEALMDPYSP